MAVACAALNTQGISTATVQTETNDPETCDPETRDPTTCDPETRDPKEAGVQEARSQEARVQEARVQEARNQKESDCGKYALLLAAAIDEDIERLNRARTFHRLTAAALQPPATSRGWRHRLEQK